MVKPLQTHKKEIVLPLFNDLKVISTSPSHLDARNSIMHKGLLLIETDVHARKYD